MPSLDSVWTRSLLATGIVQQAVTDSPVAIRIRYVGTGAVTSVTVTTATNIVFVSTGTGEGTQTYAFSTYTTISSLVAAINAGGVWNCKVLDALLSDATTGSPFVNGAITSSTDTFGTTIWDVKVDTDVALSMTATLTGNRAFNSNYDVKAQNSPQHRVHLQELKYFVTLGAAGANLVNIYIRHLGITESLVWTGTSVSATLETINWASGMGKISGQNGDEIICRISDGTSISDAAANYISAAGYTE